LNEREKAQDLVKEDAKTFKMEYGDINKVDRSYLGYGDLSDNIHFDEVKEIIPALKDIDKEIENATGDRKDKLLDLKDQLTENLKNTDWSTALSSLNEYEQNIRATADSNGVLSRGRGSTCQNQRI